MSIDPIYVAQGTNQGEENEFSSAELQTRLNDISKQLSSKADDYSPEIINLRLTEIEILIALKQSDTAYKHAFRLFSVVIEKEQWENVVRVSDLLFRCDGEDALQFLGQGVWLAVTFPINAELSVRMLHHIVENTPDDSDGAAVAAAAAAYIVDLRCSGMERSNLEFATTQVLGLVARRHSQIENQSAFSEWMRKLELNDPEKFLVRLRNVIDVLVQDNWSIDRRVIRRSIPVE